MTTGVRNSSFKSKAVGDFKGGGVPQLREAGAGPDAAAGGLLRGLQEPGARRACGGSASGRSASCRVTRNSTTSFGTTVCRWRGATA